MADILRVSRIAPHGAVFPRKTSLGWVGSKKGTIGDLVTIDGNGYIDQAVAPSSASVGAVVANTTKIGVLLDDVASSVAAASQEALDVRYQPLGENDLLEMQVVNGTPWNTRVDVTAALEGDVYGASRSGSTLDKYALNIAVTSTPHFKVVKVDTKRNTVWVSVVRTLALS